MKLLVTVGTTSFDSLIAAVDQLVCDYNDLDVISQIGPGSYRPSRHRYFSYEPDLFARYPDRLVVAHCGAGSVYQLLELGRRFLAIPNLERNDVHQAELARYLDVNGLALVCWNVLEIGEILTSGRLTGFAPRPYVRERFNAGDEIRLIINRPE